MAAADGQHRNPGDLDRRIAQWADGQVGLAKCEAEIAVCMGGGLALAEQKKALWLGGGQRLAAVCANRKLQRRDGQAILKRLGIDADALVALGGADHQPMAIGAARGSR